MIPRGLPLRTRRRIQARSASAAGVRRLLRAAGIGSVAGMVAGLILVTLVGCGIRSTSVPVDAGSAPTRVWCSAPSGSPLPGAGGEKRPPENPENRVEGKSTVQAIYLVCSSRVLAVERSVRMPAGTGSESRREVARTLLDELRAEPYTVEAAAGFSTDVPDGLRVEGPEKGDPEGAVRLSRQPDELPSFALAQIVCTFAGSRIAGTDRTIILGGPVAAPPKPLLRYECDSALRSDPEAARSAGVPLQGTGTTGTTGIPQAG